MAIAQAMWCHGHSVRIEHENQLQDIWRAGMFVRITGRPNAETWIHYAIPTPVISDDHRLQAGSVMIRCQTTLNDIWIAAVHIYDGEKLISRHDDKHDGDNNWRYYRYSISGQPDISWGLGLSIKLKTALATQVDTREAFKINISSVGCDFLL